MATRNDTNEQNKAVDEAARTARTVTDEAARVGEQTARAGADVARRGADVARDSFQAGLNTASESFRRVADQFTNVLGFNGPQAGPPLVPEHPGSDRGWLGSGAGCSGGLAGGVRFRPGARPEEHRRR